MKATIPNSKTQYSDDVRKKLLETPIHDLDIKFIQRHFNTKMKLKTFIKLNTYVINDDRFVVNASTNPSIYNYPLYAKGLAWRNLKKFLIDNGFDYKFWIMLLPGVKNLNSIETKYIKKIPFHLVTMMRRGYDNYSILAKYILRKEGNNCYNHENLDLPFSEITVGKVLELGISDINQMIIKGFDGNFLNRQGIDSFRKSLSAAQNKLFKLGFREEPFMDLKIYPKDKTDFICYLKQNESHEGIFTNEVLESVMAWEKMIAKRLDYFNQANYYFGVRLIG